MTSRVCPRCHAPLQIGWGDLGEDVCGGCDGRLLSPLHTRRVLIDEGGIDPALVRELAEHYGGARLPCPLCQGRMSPVTLKATSLDVCLGCGATFLDAGELTRVSQGRHSEVLGTPTARFLVDRQPREGEEAPADPRATWEKALPMYAVEATVLFPVCHAYGLGGSPLGALGVALGIMGVPLCLSMFVDMDLRSLFSNRYRMWSLPGHRYGGYGGTILFVVAVAVGGVITTLNAAISERLPSKLARWSTAALLFAATAAALFMT